MIKIVGRNGTEIRSSTGKTVGEVASSLGLRAEKFVFIKNGMPCTSDKEVSESDDLVFLEVFSGG
ncbi:MAG: MoaD/ThiS family protein [Thermoplasmataceae archaeon]|jgi:sulfur carrier protein ThiS